MPFLRASAFIHSQNVYVKMACVRLRGKNIILNNIFKSYNSGVVGSRLSFCTEKSPEKNLNDNLSGFAKSFEKQTEILLESEKPTKDSTEQESFASLLKNSKFMQVCHTFDI